MDASSALLVDRDLGRLALHQLIALAAHRRRRVQDHRVPQHQPVEEAAQGGKMLLLGRDAGMQFVVVRAHPAGRDLPQLQPVRLAPVQELAHGVKIGPPGMRIPEFR